MPDLIEYSVRDLIPNPDLPVFESRSVRSLHQMTQARLSRKYRTFKSEVELHGVFQTSCGPVSVAGRLDGFRKTRQGITLYEIKTVPGKAQRWVGDASLKWARFQLQFYAAVANASISTPWGKPRVNAALLMLAGTDGSLAEEPVEISTADDLLARRLEVVLDLKYRRRSTFSIDALREFIDRDSREDRPIQIDACRQLAQLEGHEHLLLALPPGAGKTRIALRWGLQKAAETKTSLYWITEKVAGRDEVLREIGRYLAAGIHLRCVWKTSSARLCDCGLAPEFCERRSHTQDRLFLEGFPRVTSRDECSPGSISLFAADNLLCPHELMSAAEDTADVVIADLNYLLNRSTLHRRRAVLILDEVQNIAARILENSQVSLSREDLRSLRPLLPAYGVESLQRIMNPAEWNPDDLGDIRRHWLQLSDSLAMLDSQSEIAHRVRKSASYWSSYPAEYHLGWYRDEHGTSIAGTLSDATPVAEKLLDNAVAAIALSGSLPAGNEAKRMLFPLYGQFTLIEIRSAIPPVVRIIPKLDFKYPLTAEDHEQAVQLLRQIREKYSPSVAVFGQNRASNEILAWQMRVRGFTTWLDSDIQDDWSGVEYAKPDFIFFALGGRLSESVNPPQGLFSAAAVLSPGYTVSTIYDRMRSHRQQTMNDFMEAESVSSDRVIESVSRIIQAAGRLQRSPGSMAPVFLLNQDFAAPEFLRQWPSSWFVHSAQDLIHPSLDDALQSTDNIDHAL